jgi:hypothetical protein
MEPAAARRLDSRADAFEPAIEPRPGSSYRRAIDRYQDERQVRMRKGFAVLVVVLAAAVFPAVALANFHATDPTGDANGATDLTTVDVSNDANGNITFNVGFVSHTLGSDELLVLALDTDSNPATGQGGIDVIFFLTATGWSYAPWNGTQFAATTSHGPMNATLGAANFTVTANKADLGNTSKFNFFVESVKGPGDSTDVLDDAPDGTAVYTYSLATVSSLGGTFTGTAGHAAHRGKTVSVSAAHVTLSDGTTANADSFSCKATLNGKPLASTGKCAWHVPKKAKGNVVVTLTAVYQGQTYTTKFTLPVRK